MMVLWVITTLSDAQNKGGNTRVDLAAERSGHVSIDARVAKHAGGRQMDG